MGAGYLAEFPTEIDKDRTRFGIVKNAGGSLGFYEIYTNSLTKPDYVRSQSAARSKLRHKCTK